MFTGAQIEVQPITSPRLATANGTATVAQAGIQTLTVAEPYTSTTEAN
jgi:hypothetical protein